LTRLVAKAAADLTWRLAPGGAHYPGATGV